MKNLYIRIAEFGYKNPQGFTVQELENFVQPLSTEEKVLGKHFEQAFNAGKYGHNASFDPPFFLFEEFHGGYQNCRYGIKSDILFSYIDYLEFQAAITSSRQAMGTAIVAIIISIVAIVFQIYTSIELDEDQFNEIKNLISSEVKQ